MTQNKISLLLLSLASILCWTDSSPVDLGLLEYDNLDTDISDLKYESQDGTLDDFFKSTDKKVDTTKQVEGSKTKISASGSKKKTSDNTGLNTKYSLEDIKKFFKQAGLHNAGTYDDGGVYAVAKGTAATGVGIAGNEERKYKKGTKSKGFHKVSHKDEYNNDKEFYAEDETSGVIKKIGAKGLGFEASAGAGAQKGYYHHDHDKGLFGKQGFSDQANLNKEFKGYTDAQEFESYFKINNK